MKRTALAALAIAVLAASCGQPGSSAWPDPSSSTAACTAPVNARSLPTNPGHVTIGSADFPESEVLAVLYGQAMQAKGVTVNYHLDIGARAAYIEAMRQGSIGMVPEYTGAMLTDLDPKDTTRSPAQVYQQLRRKAACSQLTVTDKAPAEDVDTITVTKSTATKYHLATLADLAPIAGKLTLGAPSEFRDADPGTIGLQRDYHVTFGRFASLSPSGSITQTALQKGTVDAADIFSTDPSVAKFGYVQLQDPKHTFGSQNIVPLFRDDNLTQPMAHAVNAVSAKLTTRQLTLLNARIADGQRPTDAAKAWLTENGLG